MKVEFEYTENTIDEFGISLQNELKNNFKRLGDDTVDLIFNTIMKSLVKQAKHQDNELIKINFKGIEDKKVVDFNFANDPSEVFSAIKGDLTKSLNEKIDVKTIDNIFNVLIAYCEDIAQKKLDQKDATEVERDVTIDNIKNLKLRSEYKRELEKTNSLNM